MLLSRSVFLPCWVITPAEDHRLRAFVPSHVIHLSLKHHAPHLRDLEAPEGDEENHETTLLTGRVG